jgi:excisionase family DNA binding protein
MTLAEAAQATGLSVDTLRRRVKAGALPAHKDNAGRWRITAQALQAGATRERRNDYGSRQHSEQASLGDTYADSALLAQVTAERDRLVEALAAEREERARLLATIERLSDALATRDRGAVSRGLAWARARMRAKDQPQ